jgi:hypothetical protein
MNRISLEVILQGEKGLKLTLWYLDDRFLSKPKNDIKRFSNSKLNFTMYSRKSFSFNEAAIRFPDSENYESGSSYEKDFYTESDRKEFLRRLFISLLLWNNNFTDFKYSPDFKQRSKKMILTDEFWML